MERLPLHDTTLSAYAPVYSFAVKAEYSMLFKGGHFLIYLGHSTFDSRFHGLE